MREGNRMSQYLPPPTGYQVGLPGWFRSVQETLPTHISDPDERIRLVNELSRQNVVEGSGGPFAALVIDRGTDEIVAAGVNLVLHAGLATAHAEVVALSLAQTRISTWSLAASPEGDRALVVNAQPCAMCLGALIWSGVRALEFSVAGSDVERITGFDEGPVPADWREHLGAREIDVATGRLEAESIAVLRDFRSRVDGGATTLYNGR